MALLLLALLGPAAAWGCWQLWAWYQLRSGSAALEDDDFEAAQRHLAACLRAWPDGGEVLLLAARAARRADDLDAAEQHLAEHERRGGDAEARAFEWAMLRAQQNRLADVESYLKTAARRDGPDGLLALEALAKGYFAGGRFDDGMTCLDDLLRRRPDHFRARLLRGQAQDTAGEVEEALRDFEAAVAARPASFEARLRRAGALEHLGRVADALAEYEVLRAARPDNAEVLLALARLKHDAHELDEADALLRHLLALQPDNAGALAERARILLRRGDPAEAERLARQGAGPTSGERDAFLVLALALEAQGKADEARECRARIDEIDRDRQRLPLLMRAAGAAPDDPEPRCHLALALLRLGHTEAGLRELNGVLRQDPDCPAAHAILASYYERVGQPEKAAPHRQR
jgi:predicted Zn-dependent protease